MTNFVIFRAADEKFWGGGVFGSDTEWGPHAQAVRFPTKESAWPTLTGLLAFRSDIKIVQDEANG